LCVTQSDTLVDCREFIVDTNMPGPKMGPRPADFDEEVIKQSPTFVKWTQLQEGEKLRYACRDFIRGHDQDEERLMRRIMIARRNNLRDHAILKKARKRKGGGRSSSKSAGNAAAAAAAAAVATASAITTSISDTTDTAVNEAEGTIQVPLMDPPPPIDETMVAGIPSTNGEQQPIVKQEEEDADADDALMDGTTEGGRMKRRPASTFSDSQVSKEMDVPAVQATRSYRSWIALEEGQEFLYNQKYIKGKEGHDWLLRKNIWRRMRYRRENKKMIIKLIEDNPEFIENQHPRRRRGETTVATENGHHHEQQQTASEIVDDALSPLEGSTNDDTPNENTKSSAQDNPSNQGQANSTNPANEQEAVGSKRASDGEDPSDLARPAKMLKLEGAETQAGLNGATISESDALPSFSQHSHHHHSSHLDDNENNYHTHSDDDEATNAALTAAAAATATASSGADDLVELSAVEAAVAAAASYVQLANQDNQAEEDEEEEDHDPSVVHNPLDAAALDSAARLAAAAATAQEAQLNEEEEEDDELVQDLDESNDNIAGEGVPV